MLKNILKTGTLLSRSERLIINGGTLPRCKNCGFDRPQNVGCAEWSCDDY